MTEQEFKNAQLEAAAKKKTLLVTPEEPENPVPPLTLEGINRRIDGYVPQLESIRRGLVGCKMYLSTFQTPGSGNPYPTVDLDTVEYAENVVTDVAGHTMTVVVPGFYLVVFQVDFDASSVGNSLAVDVKNGATTIGYAAKKAAGNTDYIGSSFTAKFNGNETLSLGASTSNTVLNGSSHTFLSITKLSI